MTYTVSQVAALSGVTVRTLHHYDTIGLLPASRRTDSGYRIYNDSDLERLQEVLFFRELGLGLDEIRASLADSSLDRRAVLQRQRRLMVEHMGHYSRMVAAIDRAIDACDKGTTMSKEDMFEVFGDFDPAEYEDEARQRWGGTDLYAESQRRTGEYGKEDWQQMGAESKEISESLAAAMESGVQPDAEEAMGLAEQHRRLISRWFYPCSYEVHRGLGEMYVADARFAAHWDAFRPGLASFVRDAIVANARRAGE